MPRPKIAAALVAAGAFALAALSGPAAAEDVYRGPTCADITGGGSFYRGGVVNAQMELGDTACKTVTYTLYVSDGTTTTTLLHTATGTPGTSDTLAPAVNFEVEVDDPTAHPVVCLYVTTSRGRHVFDRAPDTGCVQETLDSDDPPALTYK